jgi:hypothetical protein
MDPVAIQNSFDVTQLPCVS